MGGVPRTREIWEWRVRSAQGLTDRLRSSLYFLCPQVNSSTAPAREPLTVLALPGREGDRVNPGLSMAAALVQKRPWPQGTWLAESAEHRLGLEIEPHVGRTSFA